MTKKKEKEPSMLDVDIIIPAYGESKLLNKGVASIATQWKVNNIHLTIVDDCSPNTDCHYQDLVDIYSKMGLDIKVVVTPENLGQGGARQFGVDNTKNKWFMFMDEDDMIGSPIAISQFVGLAETYNYIFNPDGTVQINEKGKPVINKNVPKLAIVAGPLFEFDEHHTHVIEANNHVWINSKLYNREFVNKHNIRFNERQSRHAEDYYWTSCFFYALDHDPKYMGMMLPDDTLVYIWYPNQKSQTRIDPHYGYMLAGYTMDGSCEILKYMRDEKTSNIKWKNGMQDEYEKRCLNMTVYSYYTFFGYLRHVCKSDFIPKENDWYLLRDACNTLKEETKKYWYKYDYIQKVEELFGVKNYSDVQYSLPFIEFDDYILNGCVELTYSYEELLKIKENYDYDDEGKITRRITPL